ncbi:MAG TPA: BACON domain-containing carbohydrate-binding protein [Thermoanaerobaculia bacterium]|nr:BACON domain-containing carbohydrate-binding protein [Thermoanaerobaculia bacterium]
MLSLRSASLLFLIALCVPLSAGVFERHPLPRTVILDAREIAGTDTYAWVIDGSERSFVTKVDANGTIDSFQVPAFPLDRLALDPLDGSVWYASPYDLGHVTLTGEATNWRLPYDWQSYQTEDLLFGPDGNLWVTQRLRVIRVTREGEMTVFPMGFTENFFPTSMAVGPDGKLWMVAHDHNAVGTLTLDGALTVYRGPENVDSPNGIATADGKVWFTSNFGWLRHATTEGVITDVTNAFGASGPLVYGGGRLWFVDIFSATLRKYDIATNNVEATYALSAASPAWGGLWPAPSAVWWTAGKKFGRVTYAGEQTSVDYKARGPRPTHMASSPTDVWFASADENLVGRRNPETGQTVLYPLPHANSRPRMIVLGPEAMWFTEELGDRIGRIDENGTITEFNVTSVGGKPTGITHGPDGNIWFTLAAADKIGRITPAGVVTEFPLPGLGRTPQSIVFGPDGNAWFTSPGNNTIGRMTTAGVVTEFPVASEPRDIVAAPDGTLWYSLHQGMYSISTSGEITRKAPFPQSQQTVVGPDGAIWSNQINGLSRVTMDGMWHEWRLQPGELFVGQALTTGPDGRIWFSEDATGTLYRVIPDAPITGSANAVCRDPYGESVSGIFARFVDPDPTREAADYTATIDWGVGTNLWFNNGMVEKVGPGTFDVRGGYASPSLQPKTIKVMIHSKPGPNAIGQTAGVIATIVDVTLTPARTSFHREGGSSTIAIETACSWAATTDVSWITFSSASSGNGTDAVLSFDVQPNPGTLPRSGSIRINGTNVLIEQSEMRNPQSSLYLVTPCRFLDTRNTNPIAANGQWELAFAGRCGIPNDATAVVANVTVIHPAANGYLGFYRGGSAWPGNGTVPFRTGRTRANNALIPLRFDTFALINGSSAPVQFVIDVSGYFR